jgi:hypothetical protein
MSIAARASPLLALLAVPAGAAAQERREVDNVWVLTEGRPMAERQVARRRPFYQQTLLIESNVGARGRPAGIQFDLSPQELDALRDRHDMDDHAPWVLLEYHARGAGSDAPARHLGWLHCSFRLVTFVGQVSTCLRDGDGDGRLDGAVTIPGNRVPPEGLSFAPIAPVAYRYVPRDRAGSRYPGENHFGLAYDFDQASGRLRFSVELFGPGLPADFKPSVEVDPARLPATVELGGAALTLLAWDGRRATVRVDRPFPARPVRLIREERGAERGWRFDYVDVPLPGEGR